MKKRTISLTLAAVTLVSCLSIPTASAVSTETLGVQVTVNDEVIEFPDAQPFVDENSRTLIPVRFVTEAMGAAVTWSQASQTANISKDGIKVEITIGQKNLKVTEDGKTSKVKMDTAAVAKDGRTYVPIRFVAEALGAYVGYSDLYKCVEIVMPDELTADEIKRLRSYPMNQYLDTSLYDQTLNSWWLDREEYKYFTGNYWFSNSHLFVASYDKPLGISSKDIYRKVEVSESVSARTYSKFAVDYIENVIENQRFTDRNDKPYDFGFWSGNHPGTYDLDIDFRTDYSMVYQMVCQPFALISVRGVMEVTVNDITNKEWFAKYYGIENAQSGKTYSIDCEFILATNGNGFIYDVADFRFDENGNALPFHVGNNS
jgi:hypothetical protein